MPLVELRDGTSVHCYADDFLWPWQESTPAFLVHGFARSGLFWQRWVPTLAQHRRVYRPEVRGCGLSPAPPEGHVFDGEGIVEDLIDVMDALEIEKVHWVGEHSGSLFGMIAALRHPERVASVVLCDPPPGRVPITEDKLQGEATKSDAILKIGIREWCARTIGERIDTRNAHPELPGWITDEIAKTPTPVAAAINSAYAGIQLAGELASIDIPALMIMGDHNAWVVEQQQTLVESLPQARLKVFEGLGHGISLLEPVACAQAAVGFWGEVEGAPIGNT